MNKTVGLEVRKTTKAKNKHQPSLRLFIFSLKACHSTHSKQERSKVSQSSMFAGVLVPFAVFQASSASLFVVAVAHSDLATWGGDVLLTTFRVKIYLFIYL